ncbi:non-ribosomal peptide synthetase [Solibacillus merdavium]|uniref:Amino acid adenylation domain-containing protein n=1 Tax=Solibacillus merdavium TaxID=2762218 RepID=A0ABR8XM88_9BACL|nr:non-ribosomal peptide synthetase [Solibacillus merdavium]MBD8033050.1 amino acid adenylation domain-containing protein [Solibacillus merdavium]
MTGAISMTEEKLLQFPVLKSFDLMTKDELDKLISFIHQEFSVPLSIETIYAQKDLVGLADFLDLLKSLNNDNNVKPIKTNKSTEVLSHNQDRMYLAHRLGNQQLYNMPFKFNVKGKVDQEVLKNALTGMVQKHSILRTVFVEEPYVHQVVKDVFEVPFIYEDLRYLNRYEAEQYIENRLQHEVDRHFSLVNGPLFNVALYQIEECVFVLICNFHHIIFDGVSFDLFFKELLKSYECDQLDIPTDDSAFPMQYVDFAYWQKELMETNDTYQESFWKGFLNQEEEILALPLDFRRTNYPTFAGSRLETILPKSLQKLINKALKNSKTTLFIYMMTAYQVFLTRYTGKSDVVIGSTAANRTEEAFANTIGCFVNTLPYKLSVSEEDSFANILIKNRKTILDVLDNQYYPFDKIVEMINPNRELSSSPLFQTVLAMEDHFNDKYMNSFFTLESEKVDIPFSNYELTLKVKKTEDNLILEFEYSNELFKEKTIERLMHSFTEWLFQICLYPNNAINELDYLDNYQKDQVLNSFHGEKMHIPSDESIISLFQKMVKKYGNNIAVRDEEKTITYLELEKRSDLIAYAIRGRGLKSDSVDKVGLHIDRSIDMVASMLGIMKAGCAYVPLDPLLPRERLSYIIEKSALSMCITTSKYLSAVESDFAHTINLDQLDNHYTAITLEKIKPTQTAYVIYTSGTTGKPKGVMLNHQGIVNLVLSQRLYLQINDTSKVLQFATFNFDASVYEIFGSLLNGAELHIGNNKQEMFDMFTLERQIREQEITHIVLPPAVLQELDLSSSNIKFVGSAGSECSAELVEKYRNIYFYNAYGPTEYSVWTTFKMFPPTLQYEKEKQQPVPIGRPILNTNIYVLNDHLKPLPIGGIGELYIGGLGIATGYCNMEELTAEKFVANPFLEGEMLYKSGDLVKFTDDGDLLFLGRQDQQVKIRGFRIELSEVAQHIESCQYMTGVHLKIHEVTPLVKKLVAYFTAEKPMDIRLLNQTLREKLPSYMIPSYLMQVDEFPLNANGKIDTSKLPLPTVGDDKNIEKPRTENEKILLTVFQKVIGTTKIGITDNFFELGGDSIQSIQICSLARNMGLLITPRTIFEHQTIAELASHANTENVVRVGPVETRGEVAITPIQSWFFENHHTHLHHWNQSIVFYKEKCGDIETIRNIVAKLVQHHSGLMTLFKKHSLTYVGNIDSQNVTWSVTYKELDNLEESVRQREIDRLEEQAQTTLNILDGPIMKLVIIKEKTNLYRFFWVIHHLLIDTVSWHILLEDFHTLFDHMTENHTIALPTQTSSYKDWSIFLNNYSKKIEKDIIYYWKNAIESKGNEALLKTHLTEDSETLVEKSFSKELTNQFLRILMDDSKSTVEEILLALIKQSVNEVFNIDRLWINVEGHGREIVNEFIDVTRTVGWFTSIYPLFICSSTKFNETLLNSKRAIREVPNKGFDYGILRYMSDEKITTPDVFMTFNYLGKIDNIALSSNSQDFVEVEQEPKIHFLTFIHNEQLTVRIVSKLPKDKSFQLLHSINDIIEYVINSKSLGPLYIESDFPDAEITEDDLMLIINASYENGER